MGIQTPNEKKEIIKEKADEAEKLLNIEEILNLSVSAETDENP